MKLNMDKFLQESLGVEAIESATPSAVNEKVDNLVLNINKELLEHQELIVEYAECQARISLYENRLGNPTITEATAGAIKKVVSSTKAKAGALKTKIGTKIGNTVAGVKEIGSNIKLARKELQQGKAILAKSKAALKKAQVALKKAKPKSAAAVAAAKRVKARQVDVTYSEKQVAPLKKAYDKLVMKYKVAGGAIVAAGGAATYASRKKK